MGQFSVEIMLLPGSVLVGNQRQTCFTRYTINWTCRRVALVDLQQAPRPLDVSCSAVYFYGMLRESIR